MSTCPPALAKAKMFSVQQQIQCSMIVQTYLMKQPTWDTLLAVDTATSHVKMCRWLTSYVPRSQFQVL